MRLSLGQARNASGGEEEMKMEPFQDNQ